MGIPRVGRFALALVIFASPFLAPKCAHAAWPHDPSIGSVPICTAVNDQNAPTIVSDGAGGAIIAWMDVRSSLTWDIYAQRVSASGVPQWTADGILLCGASNDQGNPRSVSDGAGGAIIVWYDGRGASIDLYAQRVDGSGAAQWTAGGVPLCTAPYEQSWPTIVKDWAHGAIVAWQDFRNGADYDIYAQRVRPDGTVGSVGNGIAVCTALNDQRYPVATSAQALGTFIAWQDRRSGTYDIYAQLVDPLGYTQWTLDGVALCTASGIQQNPAIVWDNGAGAIVAWEDNRGGVPDIYAQRVNSSGVPQWAPNGIVVCNATSYQFNPQIITDGEGGAIIAWHDARNGAGGDIYAQRVNAAGVPQWTPNGVPLCTATGEQSYTRITEDGAGGAIVAWQDNRNGIFYDIYAQKVNAAGVPQWTPNGVAVCTASSEQSWPVQSWPSIVTDGAGGAIAAWRDMRSATDFDIYAQRVEPFGYLGDPAPAISTVNDVPDDQGGSVTLSWTASYLDSVGQTTVQSYEIDRAVAPAYDWQPVGTIPATQQLSYSSMVATTVDSTPQSNPLTRFRVRALPASGPAFWDSAPDSGYSVDNIAPDAPGPFAGTYCAGTAQLHWRPSPESDLACYRLHRGPEVDFDPSPANLIASPVDTAYADPAGQIFCYKLAAVDVHGNVSGCTTLLPTEAVGVEDARPMLALAPPSPNPAARPVMLAYVLPLVGEVSLVIYDAAGRMVRTLVTGTMAAGGHSVVWDRRDDMGRETGPGLYFVRLTVKGQTLTRRLVMLR